MLMIDHDKISGTLLRTTNISKYFMFFLIFCSLMSGIATYVILTDSTTIDDGQNNIIAILIIDIILIVLLAAVVAIRFIKLLWDRHLGLTGARLHVRIVTIFAFMAAVPAVILGIASSLFFQLGVQAWFSEPVRIAVNDSAEIAKAYSEEKQKSIEAVIRAMAYDISKQVGKLEGQINNFNYMLDFYATIRELPEAFVITGDGNILAKTMLSTDVKFEDIPPAALERARQGEVVLLPINNGKFRAIIRLDGFLDSYLVIGRFIDQRVTDYTERIQKSLAGYNTLESKRSGIQITFAIIYILVGLLILFAAVLTGLWLSARLVDPITKLLGATERVRMGDLTVRVDCSIDNDELTVLGSAFNRMTTQLQEQHGALITANQQISERRHFIEAILAGVSAGVIGVDTTGLVILSNHAAETFLKHNSSEIIGSHLYDILPEMIPLFTELQKSQKEEISGQITMTRNDYSYHLMVHIVYSLSENNTNDHDKMVITFDDISSLIIAQRTAAWADVARRVAHEIKNPLTPIQLAAERLRRKYLDQINKDPEIFNQCIETIIRQVGDIGRMVDEFSSFARMPLPKFEYNDISQQIKRAVFLRRVATPEIIYSVNAPVLKLWIDRQQFEQIITNVLKNAAESIEARIMECPEPDYIGKIEINVSVDDDHACIVIKDNGRGLPKIDRIRLTEPYVTTRAKGTGLGLAIVRKVIDDHNGTMEIIDNKPPQIGAAIIFRLPLHNPTSHEKQVNDMNDNISDGKEY